MADKFKNITDDELIAEVRNRDLEENFQKNDEEELEEIEAETDEYYRREYHVLKKISTASSYVTIYAI